MLGMIKYLNKDFWIMVLLTGIVSAVVGAMLGN